MILQEHLEQARPWHALEVDEVFRLWKSGPEGLTAEDVDRRLAEYGLNHLPMPQKRGPLLRFLHQFHNVLIYILLVAGVVTALLDHWIDSGVIFAVVLINAVIGFIQEGKAERALDSLRQMLSLQANVLREGRQMTVAAENLVPGDVVLLSSGGKVPADLRLIQVKNLRIDEAALTGESEPVEKLTDPAEAQAIVGDRTCMAFSGTLVTYGRGAGVVVATGKATEIGRISEMLTEVTSLETPLLRQLASFGRTLALAILIVAALTFLFGLLVQSYSAVEMFLAAVGLAVAAIPEGLPAILTITLAIGVQRMAGRHAIIRRLPAVETLGAVTVICSDKTGTLTRGEMTVQTVVTLERLFQVTGVGYAPEGTFTLASQEVSPADHPELLELARAALLCNEAQLRFSHGEWMLEGDPTEGALITLGMKAGLDLAEERKHRRRWDTIPFESEHRFMATLHEDPANGRMIYAKGAPERIFEMCAHQRREDGGTVLLRRGDWQGRVEELASRGERVIALACKPVPQDQLELTLSDVAQGLTLVGVVGMIDPPREEAIHAVQQCHQAGIRVKMITGDHALTARAIAAQLRMGDSSRVLTGVELETMSHDDLHQMIPQVDVFARVSPEHKLRLVTALQANGEVVAMTGDGVNDAPALKRADVGVAMGIKGTEVSKEAAEMVLTDDNFSSIAHAVEEGRTVYDNIKKAILFILPTNGGEALTIIAAVVMGGMLPITPVQILWVNMITAVTLALALAFEPPEQDVMRRPPRDPRARILSPFFLWRIAFVSSVLLLGTYGLFLWERMQGTEIEAARTVAVNTLVMFEVFYLLNTRAMLAPALVLPRFTRNRAVWIAIGLVVTFQLLFTYTVPMQALFGTAPIGGREWAMIVLVSSSVFVLVELEKWFIRTRRVTHPQ
jgi:magnesium-transporting ATPase (P-type)